MESLKIKFELNGLKFEIEGAEQTVKDEFDNFKLFTQGLVDKINLLEITTPIIERSNNEQLVQNNDSDEFPLLKDIVMQDLPQTEFEWVLVYAFYDSEFGMRPFTREAVLARYRDSGRYTENRIKKFSENFKSLIGKKYIKSKNDTEYLLLEDGKQRAIEILNQKKPSASNKKKNLNRSAKNESKDKPVGSKLNSEAKILKELNLRPEGKISLKEFAAQYEITSAEELYLIIVYYMKEILLIDKVMLSHLLTALVELDKKVPTHLKQVLINYRSSENSNHWLTLDDVNDMNYSIRGMNHIKHDIKRKA